MKWTPDKAVVVVAVLVWTLMGISFHGMCPSPAGIVHAVETAANPGSLGAGAGSCRSEADLRGDPIEKLMAVAPLHGRNVPPARTAPTVVNQPLPPTLTHSIRSVKLPEGLHLIALTFDLCETEKEISGYDAEIVNYLRSNNVKATFFAGGKWMRSHPEKTMQLMADPLFEVGNHSWSHKNMRLLDAIAAQDQILWTQAQYELLWEELQKRINPQSAGSPAGKEVPRVPKVFRFPFGTCNAESLQILEKLGIPAIQWDIVSGDAAKGQSAEAITRIVLKRARPGSIAIFHANGRGHGTAESLRTLIPKLRQMGFDFTTVSELLAAGTPVSTPECFENKPGDNIRYDRLSF